MKTASRLILCLAAALLSACSAPGPKASGGMDCNGAQTSDWHAWVDLRPGGNQPLHVIGKVHVNSGGWKARLTKASPQGLNHRILLLDLHVTPPSGPATSPMLAIDVRYDERNAQEKYDKVQVHCDGKTIADLDVKETH